MYEWHESKARRQSPIHSPTRWGQRVPPYQRVDPLLWRRWQMRSRL